MSEKWYPTDQEVEEWLLNLLPRLGAEEEIKLRGVLWKIKVKQHKIESLQNQLPTREDMGR